MQEFLLIRILIALSAFFFVGYYLVPLLRFWIRSLIEEGGKNREKDFDREMNNLIREQEAKVGGIPRASSPESRAHQKKQTKVDLLKKFYLQQIQNEELPSEIKSDCQKVFHLLGDIMWGHGPELKKMANNFELLWKYHPSHNPFSPGLGLLMRTDTLLEQSPPIGSRVIEQWLFNYILLKDFLTFSQEEVPWPKKFLSISTKKIQLTVNLMLLNLAELLDHETLGDWDLHNIQNLAAELDESYGHQLILSFLSLKQSDFIMTWESLIKNTSKIEDYQSRRKKKHSQVVAAYETLDLPLHTEATTVKKVFNTWAHKNHPDKLASSVNSAQQQEKYHKMRNAYELVREDLTTLKKVTKLTTKYPEIIPPPTQKAPGDFWDTLSNKKLG